LAGSYCAPTGILQVNATAGTTLWQLRKVKAKMPVIIRRQPLQVPSRPLTPLRRPLRLLPIIAVRNAACFVFCVSSTVPQLSLILHARSFNMAS
jgi:hypothetical protein